jgi:hypothetical protein
VIHYGATEKGNVPAEQFQANIAADIARARTWMGDPEFPVILIADVYREALTAAQQSEFDRYVGAELAIAQADSNVLVVNSRRLMDMVGWNGTSGLSGEFLAPDGAHYSDKGAQVLAAAEAAAMMSEICLTSCASDWGDVNLSASMTLRIGIAGTSACTEYGQLGVAKALNLLHPTLKLELSNGFTPARGQQFKIISWASLSGTFGDVQLPALANGLQWDLSALYTTGTLSVSAPPAPSITVTSGASQAITLPAAPAPVAFLISGDGTLTVTAESSNAALVPSSAIAIATGCGSSTLPCTANLDVVNGATGSATIKLTVADTYGQVGTASVMLEVKPAAPPASEPSQPTVPPPSSDSNSSNASGSGGGGSVDLLLIAALGVLGLRQARRRSNGQGLRAGTLGEG